MSSPEKPAPGPELFNHGYSWETHEAWEGLRRACGRSGMTANDMQALINFAATGLKAHSGNVRGVTGNPQTAARLFTSVARQLGPDGGRYKGLALPAPLRWTSNLAEHPTVAQSIDSEVDSIAFEFILRLE